MNAAIGLNPPEQEDWQTLSTTDVEDGIKVSERDGDFRLGAKVEGFVRFLGIVLILGAFIQWIAPNADLVGNQVATHILLSVAFSLIGLALYAFSTRGGRNELYLDPEKRVVYIASLTRQERTRRLKKIPLDRIKSIYVRRGENGNAAIRFRMKDSASEVEAIKGQQSEIESLHRHLCRDIRMHARPGI